MIKRRGKIHRGLIVMLSTVPAIATFTRELWKSGKSTRWLVPLVIILCVMGIMLVLASSVEALAPFIYTIF